MNGQDEVTVLHKTIRALDDCLNTARVTNSLKHKIMDVRSNLSLRLEVATQERLARK